MTRTTKSVSNHGNKIIKPAGLRGQSRGMMGGVFVLSVAKIKYNYLSSDRYFLPSSSSSTSSSASSMDLRCFRSRKSLRPRRLRSKVPTLQLIGRSIENFIFKVPLHSSEPISYLNPVKLESFS